MQFDFEIIFTKSLDFVKKILRGENDKLKSLEKEELLKKIIDSLEMEEIQKMIEDGKNEHNMFKVVCAIIKLNILRSLGKSVISFSLEYFLELLEKNEEEKFLKLVGDIILTIFKDKKIIDEILKDVQEKSKGEDFDFDDLKYEIVNTSSEMCSDGRFIIKLKLNILDIKFKILQKTLIKDADRIKEEAEAKLSEDFQRTEEELTQIYNEGISAENTESSVFGRLAKKCCNFIIGIGIKTVLTTKSIENACYNYFVDEGRKYLNSVSEVISTIVNNVVLDYDTLLNLLFGSIKPILVDYLSKKYSIEPSDLTINMHCNRFDF